MRKFLALFLVLFFLSYSLAISQTLPTKTFTLQDAASSGNGADAAVAGYSIAALSILGTAGSDRVVTFSASADATNFATISCRNLSSNAVSTTVTTSGTTLVQFSCPVAGMKKLRAALSGGSAGTVTVVAVVLPEVSYNYSSPLEGHYITTQSESGLPNEVSLGDLTTGLLLNTVSASVSTPSAYVGTSCTNQFPRSLNASGAATCATVSLTADVVNTLPSSKGGTDNASYAVGDLLYASGTTALSKLADVAAGSYLRSGGAVTAPAWSTATLPNTATTGDLLYASASNVYSNLADVAAGSYLRSGGSSTAPVWSTSTLPNTATTGDLLYASASNVYSNLADVTAGSFLRSGGASTAPAWSTVTFPNSATAGDVLYASASNVYSNLADVAAGSYLRSGGASTAPVWSTTTLPNSATTGDLLYASATNVYSNLADAAAAQVLTSGGAGVAPAWSGSPTISGTVNIQTKLNMSAGPTAYDSTTTSSVLFNTSSSGGAYPFLTAGNLVLQSRASGANRDILLATGTTAVARVIAFGTGGVQLGSSQPTLTAGAVGMDKITASGSAPGAATCKLEIVAGTNANTCKLIMACGTSATAVTVVDNVGAGC